MTKKAEEIRGAEEIFSFGHIGTAAVLVLPSCGAIPPDGGGGGGLTLGGGGGGAVANS